jgi:Domain of unknown function (DUF4833)
VSRLRGLVAMLTTTLGLAVARPAPAAPADGAREVPLFLVTKSENKNRVVYALRVDDKCAPLGDAPVRAYWQMLEKGADVTEPLLSREERAYGLRQSVRSDVVRMSLNALPEREITIITWRAAGACMAAAWTTVRTERARLVDVHAVLAWPFGIAHLVVQGRTRDGRLVEEIVEP